MTRLKATFLALVGVQAAHSAEEYLGRLWDLFPPARFVTGLISEDRRFGFVVFNVTLISFGIWCFFWPVLRRSSSATAFMWFWILVELINGTGHILWSVEARGYTPGAITGPVLLILALVLILELKKEAVRSAAFSE
jgi:uncharacterized membrane protein HdeD (DUF308 family)